MVRKLKFHEKKLLKKVNFFEYKKEGNIRELEVMRRYGVQDIGEYKQYNKLTGSITKLANMIAKLDPKDPFRQQITDLLLEKMYNMGIIPTQKSLEQCANLTASAFCRRRLPVMLVRLRYAENLKEAITFVEHGHIRIGPDVVTDPAFLVTRTHEDFITWVDSSKIKKHILKYNDAVDDFDLLEAS